MEMIINEALKDLGIVFLVIIAVLVGLLICIRIWIIFRPIKSNDELLNSIRASYSVQYDNESGYGGYWDE